MYRNPAFVRLRWGGKKMPLWMRRNSDVALFESEASQALITKANIILNANAIFLPKRTFF